MIDLSEGQSIHADFLNGPVEAEKIEVFTPLLSICRQDLPTAQVRG